MSFGKRLKAYFAFRGVHTEELCEILGRTRASVNFYLTGKRFPNEEVLTQIKQTFPELNFNWLFTGEGEMLVSESGSEKKTSQLEESNISNIDNELLKSIADELKKLREENVVLREELNKVKKKVDGLDSSLGKTKTTRDVKNFGISGKVNPYYQRAC
ncbi:helix-turn-helix transcriptional regulator [Limibacter armeniacum]|uniref:helix-turn-helix domain-containing protein n=1 Tax=Limibacter armeniacum TaxID=466084 RepID=UPI002FE6C4EF